jgi:signal peptide peptidase SppA
MTDFPHLRAAVYSQPWAIIPERLESICEVLQRRLEGLKLSKDEIATIKGRRFVNGTLQLLSADTLAPLVPSNTDTSSNYVLGFGGQPSAAATSNRAQTGNAIAVITIAGIIAQHAPLVDDISGPGGTSTERVGASFRSALANPDVRSIVLNIDSPGGSVNGVQALAEEIQAARGKKPIVAQVNSLAASAAYWIAAAADEIVISPGGQVGSIGVYATHADVSKAAEKSGLKVTFISAGKYKVEGNPYAALDNSAASAMQKMVDSYYADFVDGVANGRKVSRTKVMTGFGEGRVVKDREAVREGMADRVAPLDTTLRRMSGQKGRAPSRAAADMTMVADLDLRRRRLRNLARKIGPPL